MGGIGVIGKDSNAQKIFMEMGLQKSYTLPEESSIYVLKHIP